MATTQQRLLRLAPTKDSVLDRRLGIRGEVLYDDTNRVLRIYDGELLGGYELLRADLENIDVTILNSKLTNSTVQFGSTTVSLGGSSSTLAGLTSVTATTFNGALTGNVTGNLSGNVTGNVLGNVTGNVTGRADTTTQLHTARNINGVSFNGTADITVTADANTLSGTTLKSTVVSSSLTSVGTLGNLTVTNTINGSVTGNAGTVTNGVYTNQTYDNPTWLNTLALSKVGFTAGKSFTYDSSATPALAVKTTAYTADFGATPVSSKSFTITDANAAASNSVMIYPVGSDEWEMDPIAYSAVCNEGTITLYASTSQGPVKGTRSIRYVLV
jgi:hypothetical protein